MKLGFTGTQRGMTPEQWGVFWSIVSALSGEFHEGDCIGADAQAAHGARLAGFRIVGHPPEIDAKRAFFPADEWRPKFPYLQRNKHIVLQTDEMIATPGEMEEQLRSGTWSTVRFTRKQQRRVRVILPNGSIVG